jgi:hypothetical protein
MAALVPDGKQRAQADGPAKYLSIRNAVEERPYELLREIRVSQRWNRFTLAIDEIKSICTS